MSGTAFLKGKGEGWDEIPCQSLTHLNQNNGEDDMR